MSVARWLVGAGLIALSLGGGHARAADVPEPALRLLGADNRVLDPEVDVLGASRRITHDRSLLRQADSEARSLDPENFRVELTDPSERGDVIHARLEAFGSAGERHGLLRHVPLLRVAGTDRFRSPFLRLVTDATDASAPDVGDQLLVVRLRDRVRAVVTRGGGELAVEVMVGAPGTAGGARAALRGKLRISVLRLNKGGLPVVGDHDAEALALAREQIEIANEIWTQCFVDFGDPRDAPVRIVDPPPPALLAVGDLDGLPALDGGVVVFRANGQRVGPIALEPGSTPERSALTIARALRLRGFRATVTVNPRAELGAGASADIVVRDTRGELVELREESGQPLSTDRQQRVSIGSVDLSDGIDEFDNTLAATGTLEERTLVKLLADEEPTTIDVLLINRFVNRDRQGEAFIEADGSSMANTLIFDRNAIRYERQAWVQAHELGHVLLDEAFHPDNVGPDRPWLLMDGDARQGRVTGPKRLSDGECAKARRRSGPGAHPVLLEPAP